MLIASIDTETTGFDEINNELIEVGGIIFDEKGKEYGRFGELIKPEFEIPKHITRITGITNKMVRNSRGSREVLKDFKTFLKDVDVLVAHNAKFDCRMLMGNMKKVQIKVPNWYFWDSLNMSKFIVTKTPNYKLGTLLKKYNLEREGIAHRALDDSIDLKNLIMRFIGNNGFEKVANNSSEFSTFDVKSFFPKGVEKYDFFANSKKFHKVKYYEDGEDEEMEIRHMFFYEKKRKLYSISRIKDSYRKMLDLNNITFL